MTYDQPGDAQDDRVRRPRFGIGRALLVAVLVWLGITAVTWVLDLAHRVIVLMVLAVVLFAVAKLARKS